MVAQYTARHVAQKLLDTKHLTPGLAEVEVPAKSKAAFEKALMDIDAELRKLPEVESGQDQSGSTSVMTLFSPQFVVCANTGDSRAVLCRQRSRRGLVRQRAGEAAAGIGRPTA